MKYKIDGKFEDLKQEICGDLSKTIVSSVLKAVRRIVVLGDIHGDWNGLLELLHLSKVIDKKNPNIWIGGDTVIVQVGDQIDNNREVHNSESNKDEAADIKILKYMTKLHNLATKDGGAVYSLLGNHELMNVLGDFRYVSKNNINEFSNYKKPDGTIIKNAYEARKWAFSRGHDLANFLGCTRYGILMIGSHIFVHGGLTPKLLEENSLDEINNIIRLWLFGKGDETDKTLKIIQSMEYSPLWNRLLGQLPPNLPMSSNYCTKVVKPILQITQASTINIGHTIQEFQNDKGINATCDNTVNRVDFGLGNGFDIYDKKLKITGKRSENRKPQILEILNDTEIRIIK